ncbi:dihydrodipicolinate synthase family protein [Stygiolobus caldivivus]|uniref:Dihydrodipicolinate synthase family protein n=1 Tax=Stygiolobus caldivivus TaxID=2824673 RepID=A0A8D5U7B1_9CREN|nr:dihydrodipicolinate synthase family protein [Stygiolobus caldivivus]BCU70312.1 dihydrodipicolinate synthase family protein [Stygiolobus caldivivus]
MEGIIPAIVTPFAQDETLDENALKNYLDFLKRNGIGTIFALGTTGEFNMLNMEEKEQFIKSLRLITNLKLIINVTENSLINAMKLAKQALDIGAEGIASLPPIYHKPSEKGVINYFESLSKFGLPLYLYNFDGKAYIDIEIVKRLVDEGIIEGIKLTTENVILLQRYLELKQMGSSPLHVAVGNDELISFAIMSGSDGVVSATANVAPELVLKLYKLLREGNLKEALEVQKAVNSLTRAISGGDYPAGVKVALKYRGIYVGTVRRPLEEKMEQNSLIYATLKELNL